MSRHRIPIAVLLVALSVAVLLMSCAERITSPQKIASVKIALGAYAATVDHGWLTVDRDAAHPRRMTLYGSFLQSESFELMPGVHHFAASAVDADENILFRGQKTDTIPEGVDYHTVLIDLLPYRAFCSVSPGNLAFGAVPVGTAVRDTFRIANADTSSAPLSVDVSADCEGFSIVSGGGPATLSPGQERVVVVEFAPVVPGLASCTVAVGSECVDVTCLGEGTAPDCLVEPVVLDFGEFYPGEPAEAGFSIVNTGNADLEIDVTLDCPDFTIVTGGGARILAPDTGHEVTVAYQPTAPGSHSCTIATGAACSDVTCLGHFEQPPECTVSTDTLDFGMIPLGGSTTRGFTITNTGGGTLSGYVGAECGHYAILAGGGSYELTAGASHDVTVQFQPDSPGFLTCTIYTGVDCASVECVGTGFVSECSVSATSLAFGDVELGSARRDTFTITNTGSIDLDIDVGETCPDFAIVTGAGPGVLAPDSYRVVVVEFAPTTAGLRTCVVTTGTECAEVGCTGYGTAPPECSVTPTSLDFGSVEVGQTVTRTFTITNSGGGSLDGYVSAECAGYAIVAGGGGYSLTAGASRTVTVAFTPETTGVATCTIDTGSECAGVACTGTGTQPPICTVTPQDLDFGTVSVGSSIQLSFTIQNTGGGTLTGTVSESCAPYSIVSGGGSFSLGAGAIRTVQVRFAPTIAGNHDCTILTGTACADVFCTGYADPPPACQISSTSLDFGTVEVGSTSTRSFTITNVGGGVLIGTVNETCSEYAITAGGGAYSLAAGVFRTVTVRFAPTTAGTHLCTIETGTICDNVACTGVGDLLPACLISTTSLDFGVVATGGQRDLSFSITNSGGGILAGNISEDCPDYTVVAGDGPFALGAGQTRNVTVRFQPSFEGPIPCTVQTGIAGCPQVSCTGVASDIICFSYDDGSIQDWYLTYLSTWGPSGFHHEVSDNLQAAWSDDVNYPNSYGTDPTGNGRGSFWMDTINDGSYVAPSPPVGDTWWVQRIVSPNLDDNPAWQEAVGYSARALDHMSWAGGSDCYYSLHFTVWDEDLMTERTWPDVFGDVMNGDTWEYEQVMFEGTGFPAHWHLRRVFVQIWGELYYVYQGGLYLDDVCPIFSKEGDERTAALREELTEGALSIGPARY